MTLAELQAYNFGYYFEDQNGERIYRDVSNPAEMGLQIATADQLFAEFYDSHPDLLFIVEIKNDGEAGHEACRILYETLQQYPAYMDQIVIGTFHDEIEEELQTDYPDLFRGASLGAARKFILTQYLGVNYASILPAAFISKFTSRSIEYHPETLYAYEVLVNDLQICDKAYFDAALEDMCSRFLAIPEEEIKGMLNALGVQYPAALVNYFERFIDEMRKFCQK